MVLPFQNLGGDGRVVRLAHGLTEDVVTDLGRFRNLDVIALESSDEYKAGRERCAASRASSVRATLCRVRCSRREIRSASRRNCSMPRAALACGATAGTVRLPTCSPSRARLPRLWPVSSAATTGPL